MKKRKIGRTLSRNMTQRRALLRTLLASLVESKKIKTTLAKAKELRSFAERQITYAKKGLNTEKNSVARMSSIRILKKNLPQKAINEIFNIAEVLKSRKGGYLRIIKLGFRKSDSAEMAFVEWVDSKKMMSFKKEEKVEKKTKESGKLELKKEKGVKVNKIEKSKK